MSTLEIIVLVAVVAFFILAIFGAMFLYSTCKAMQKVTQTLESIKKQIDDLDHEPRELLHHANEITSNVHGKMKCLDPIFHSVKRVGEGLEERDQDTLVESVDLAIKAIRLWQDIKKRR